MRVVPLALLCARAIDLDNAKNAADVIAQDAQQSAPVAGLIYPSISRYAETSSRSIQLLQTSSTKRRRRCAAAQCGFLATAACATRCLILLGGRAATNASDPGWMHDWSAGH